MLGAISGDSMSLPPMSERPVCARTSRLCTNFQIAGEPVGSRIHSRIIVQSQVDDREAIGSLSTDLYSRRRIPDTRGQVVATDNEIQALESSTR